MSLLFIILCIVIILFGFVVLFGAPYLPTLSKQQVTAIKLLNLKPGQTLLELGSGDGRILIAAAKQGIKITGYELNPLLVLYSRAVSFKYRHLVTIKWANYWHTPLPKCDGIYVFLLDRYMSKLDKKITQDINGNVKVVSFAFKFPDRKALTEAEGLYLYKFNNKK